MRPRLNNLLPAVFILILSLFCLAPRQVADGATFYLDALLIASGSLPYRGFAENKNPGIFCLLLPPAWAGGWDMRPAVLLFWALNLAAAALLFRLLTRLEVSRLAAGYSGLCFIVIYFYILQSGVGSRGTSTILTEVPEVLSLLLMCLALLHRRERPFRAGVWLGLACCFRQTAPLALLPALACLAALPEKGRRRSALFLLLGGALLPAGLALLAAWRQGWLVDWYQYAVTWAQAHTNCTYGEPLTLGPRALRLTGLLFAPLPWCALAVGAGAFLVLLPAVLQSAEPRRRARWIFAAALLLSLFIETCLPGQFYTHHLLVLLPGLAVCTALALDEILRREPRGQPAGDCLRESPAGPACFNDDLGALSRPNWVRQRALPVLIMLPALLLAAPTERLLQSSAAYLKGASPYSPRAACLGRWIQTRTAETDKILVWGFAPEVYLAARRLPASRHLYHLILTNCEAPPPPEESAAARQFQEDLRSAAPPLIVLWSSHPIRPYLGDLALEYRPDQAPAACGGVPVLSPPLRMN